jgi:hypothetical protein
LDALGLQSGQQAAVQPVDSHLQAAPHLQSHSHLAQARLFRIPLHRVLPPSHLQGLHLQSIPQQLQ